MFGYAEQFRVAAIALGQGGPKGEPPQLIVPSVVHGAIAFELYLKCLIRLEGGSIPRKTHDHEILFAKVSPSAQADVRARFDLDPSRILLDAAMSRQVPHIDITFDGRLKSGKNAFVSFPVRLRIHEP